MWLLIVIHLSFQGTPHVEHAEIVQIMDSEKKCVARTKEIFEQAKKQNKPIPDQVNMGCVPLNGSRA